MPGKRKRSSQARVDSADDTYGVRGAGAATWQARFGMALNERDLLFAVRREPVAKRTVIDVAHDIFSKGFTVEEVAEKPDPNWSREVSKVLDDLNARACLTRLVLFERLFGWAILALTYVDYGKDASAPLENPREIRELLPYSSLQCTVRSSDEDKAADSARFGLPVLYTVRRSGVGAQQAKIHFSRVIHYATRLLDHPWRGLSVLEVMYDDQTVLRNERWALGETLIRHAAGFANITLKGAKRKQIEDFEDEQQLHRLNARSYFVHDEKATVDWVGAAGKALNPEPYVTPTMESLSCGSRIPVSHLRGANAGTLAGSEVNDREYWGGIAALQELGPTAVLWELIDRLMETGQIRRVNDYRIVWPAGFELTESEKAAIKLQLAQARSLETDWKSVDEVRAEDKLDPLPGGVGNVVLGLRKAEQQPFGQGAAKNEEAAEGADVGLLGRIRGWFRKRGKKDMISEVIAGYLKEQLPEDRVYEVGEYYPGELPFCLRQQYFRYTQPKQTPVDREQLFGVGYLWQACIKEALDNSGVNVVAENKIHRLKVPDSDLVLVCQPDFELDVDGQKIIVELKSVAGLGKFAQPMREHVLQVTPYLKVCKADSALIVYVNKQTGETREFPVKLEEENLMLVFERAKRLDRHLRGKELPPACGSGQDWQCTSCEYQTECETFS